MDTEAALDRAGRYIDDLTVDSPVNAPEAVLGAGDRFFTWDNEKRAPENAPYLYHWSYYNGVVMEGLFDIHRAGHDPSGRYLSYVRRYLEGLLTPTPAGEWTLSPEKAGYVDCHGADCYKTAALLLAAAGEDDGFLTVCRNLYRDLTDENYRNSTGHIVPVEYSEEALGHNYWHTWAKDRPPKYRVWLDGIYMLQPFIARYARLTDDGRQLALVRERLDWVWRTLRAENGLYYHAGSSKTQVCPYHWTRSMGWYGMAMADVAEILPERDRVGRREALRDFADGLLRCRLPSGLWANLTRQPVTETNREETSGTAMMAYTLLKGARLGLLDRTYAQAGAQSFLALTERKLTDGRLRDIYLKASANGANNYEMPEYYLTDEGKGLGPYIMAYSEMLRYV